MSDSCWPVSSASLKVGDKLIFRAKLYEELKKDYSYCHGNSWESYILFGQDINLLNLKYWERYLPEESLISSVLNLDMLHNESQQLCEFDKVIKCK
jgi:hypothetical protein